MIKALRLCICSVIALLSFAHPAAADWHFTPFIGVTLGGNTTISKLENLETGERFARRDWVFGGSVTWIGRRPVGVEGLLAYVPNIFERSDLVTGSHSLAAMGNVVLTIPRAWSEHGLRPFVSGGLGVLRVSRDDLLDLLPVRRNVVGYNFGGGAFGPLSDRTGVRFEARRYSYLKSGDTLGVSLDRENLSFWTATVGVVIRY